jgi:hypothetical protein
VIEHSTTGQGDSDGPEASFRSGNDRKLGKEPGDGVAGRVNRELEGG